MLAAGQPGTALPPGVVYQVAEATGVILAEATAAARAVLAPAAGGSRAPANPSLLITRLTRLENAAREAIASAREGHPVTLRQQLRRFESLTSAMWTVQLSACDRPQAAGPARAEAGLPAGAPLRRCRG